MMIKVSQVVFPTCILVFTTSRGVFPKTLAAPAVAPNIAVTMGCISFLGSSPLVAEPTNKSHSTEGNLTHQQVRQNKRAM